MAACRKAAEGRAYKVVYDGVTVLGHKLHHMFQYCSVTYTIT